VPKLPKKKSKFFVVKKNNCKKSFEKRLFGHWLVVFRLRKKAGLKRK